MADVLRRAGFGSKSRQKRRDGKVVRLWFKD
jgi:hypothetical protein